MILFLGGLLCFLYGMYEMTVDLKRAANKKIERNLDQWFRSPQRGLMAGIGITAVIQSSSAVTVMLVGLVHAGILRFPQTIGVIMGADIGTTATAWLLSLTGLKNLGVISPLLQPEIFPLIFLFLGAFLQLPFSSAKRTLGKVCLGFGILLYGMQSMSNGALLLVAESGYLKSIMEFDHPIMGFFIGMIVTGIIQSSSAAVGILQSFSLTGMVTGRMALPLIMGINVGTCVTAVLASLGVRLEAKQVAAAHIAIKIGGVIIGGLFYFLWEHLPAAVFLDQPITPVQVACMHTLFNVITVLFIFPFRKQLVRWIPFLWKANRTE